MIRKDIRAIVIGVIEEYGSNNPFDLAELMGLSILYHSLPDTLDAYRLNDMIVVNVNLPYNKRKWVLAHELGHYIIHGPEVTLGNFIKNKLLIKPKIEKEADYFAGELLLIDIDKYKIDGLTSEQLSEILSIPKQCIEYKFNGGENNDCCNL